MKMTVRFFAVPVFLMSQLLAGCVPVTPKAGDVIGVLRVSGPNVWLNDAPAGDGAPVRLGNSLATGAGSSALLEFRDGGHLQLDQNTDPIFEWLEQSKCILVRIFKGQAFLDKGRACIEGPNISLVLNSEVNVLVQQPPAPSRVTLLKGSAEVTVPVRVKLVPGEQLVTEGRRPAVRTLSAAELRSVVDWRREYRFRPLPVPQPEGPGIFFPPRTRPSRPRDTGPEPKPKPEPAPPSEPSGKSPMLERGMRVPPELIRRDSEPVIR